MSRKILHLQEEIVQVTEESKENKYIDLKEHFKDASYFQNSTPVSRKQKLSFVETKSIESKKYNSNVKYVNNSAKKNQL